MRYFFIWAPKGESGHDVSPVEGKEGGVHDTDQNTQTYCTHAAHNRQMKYQMA